MPLSDSQSAFPLLSYSRSDFFHNGFFVMFTRIAPLHTQNREDARGSSLMFLIEPRQRITTLLSLSQSDLPLLRYSRWDLFPKRFFAVFTHIALILCRNRERVQGISWMFLGKSGTLITNPLSVSQSELASQSFSGRNVGFITLFFPQKFSSFFFFSPRGEKIIIRFPTQVDHADHE